MKRIAATLIVCASALMCAWGQTPVRSLDSCVEYALEHNASVLLQEVEAQRSRAGLVRSKLDLLPTLNIYLNQYYNWGRSVDMQELVIVRNRLTRQTSASVGASFLIFDGFARINTIEMNRRLVQVSDDNLRQTVLEVKADIARAYLANILARLSQRQLEASLENVSRQAERCARQLKLGAVTRGDCLALEAKAADIRSRIAAAQAEEASQMEQLRSLMGCGDEFDTDTLAAGGEIPPLPFSMAGFELKPPGISAAERGVEAARFALKAARGAALPTLSASASYGTYYSDASPDVFKEQLDGNQNPSVSLSLVLPLFNGGKSAEAISNAKSDLEAARIKLEQARQQAALYREQLDGQCATLHSQTLALKANCALLEERLQTASKEYGLGAISTSEWIDAAEALLQGECDYAQSLCKYLFQIKIMEYYTDECR